MKFTTFHYFLIFIAIAAVGLIGARFWGDAQPGQYDELAQCVADSGATFFGAFWCPHCQDQKSQFGNSADLLPYVECSTPDGQNQTKECIDAGIKSYPTWEFADGSRETGVQSPAELAEITGCVLPNEA